MLGRFLTMTKLEIEAIRALPEEWVSDGVFILNAYNCPVAMHNLLPPMIYTRSKWRPLSETAPDQSETQAHPKAAGSD